MFQTTNQVRSNSEASSHSFIEFPSYLDGVFWVSKCPMVRLVSSKLLLLGAYRRLKKPQLVGPVWIFPPMAGLQNPHGRCHDRKIPAMVFSSVSGSWLTYPSEKLWVRQSDDELPNIWKSKSHVPSHQPVIHVQTCWFSLVSGFPLCWYHLVAQILLRFKTR